jgi:hypothetical protein
MPSIRDPAPVRVVRQRSRSVLSGFGVAKRATTGPRANGAPPFLFVLCRVFHACAAPQRTPIFASRETQVLGLFHEANHKM